jgi:hypothetical protein
LSLLVGIVPAPDVLSTLASSMGCITVGEPRGEGVAVVGRAVARRGRGMDPAVPLLTSARPMIVA